ncbi:MAG: hypothetical protein JWM14_1573 [Chitinophagaceae bacterium]|nr:hypothetical protein [Chitinophagaceae bacterium]
MQRTWFKTKAFTALEIEEFQSISKHKVIQSATVSDMSIIQSLVEGIEQIDPNGDMMVSWGPDAQYMTLTFINEKEREVIEVIQQKFKTPSTGFYGRNEQEASLYTTIRTLLD